MDDIERLAKDLEGRKTCGDLIMEVHDDGTPCLTLTEIPDATCLEAATHLRALAAEVEALRKRLGPEIEKPIEPGGFVGDIFFGHPEKTTFGTHRWNGAEWKELPTELEAVLLLLADARKRLAETEEALANAVGALDGAGEALSEFANILSRDPWEANQAYQSARDAQDAIAAWNRRTQEERNAG